MRNNTELLYYLPKEYLWGRIQQQATLEPTLQRYLLEKRHYADLYKREAAEAIENYPIGYLELYDQKLGQLIHRALEVVEQWGTLDLEACREKVDNFLSLLGVLCFLEVHDEKGDNPCR